MGYDYETLSSPYVKRVKNVFIYDLGGGISVYSTFGVVDDFTSRDELFPPPKDNFAFCDNNVFLVKKDDDMILFDAGVGDDINTACRVKLNFEDIGIDITQIETIIMTHLHPDHATGLTVGTPTIFGGKPEKKFNKAKVYIPKRETDFWLQKKLNSDEASSIYYTELQWTGHNTFFEFDSSVVKDMIATYGSDVMIFDESFNGDIAGKDYIKKIDLFGHTPGHTAYLIKGGSRDIIIAGDFVNHAPIQIEDTSVAGVYDFNFDEAKKSRERLMKYALENDIVLCSSRSIAPGFLKII